MSDTTRGPVVTSLLAAAIVVAGALAAPAQAVTKGQPARDVPIAAGTNQPVPKPLVGPDGSLTRSTLDPEALVTVGEPAPDFSVATADGKFFRLLQQRQKTNVVLVFCPDQAAMPGCAARLASLRQSKAELARLNARVYVVLEWKGPAPAAARKPVQPGITYLNDKDLKVSSCYARRAPGEPATPRPMLVIVDTRGKVVSALDDRGGTRPATPELLKALGPAHPPAPAPPPNTR
ncbi:MAG TPA: redoxin domain-containing protein [Candidatus Polarisedimenticolia bacterium]|nr:redoxin domain-containing protein [Candidatus Polarisedimenticolia bacterium]